MTTIEDNNVFNIPRAGINFKDGFGVGHGQYIQTVVNNLINGILEAPVSADESIKSLKLVHAIYTSSDEKRWVSMDENVKFDRLGK